MKQFFMLLFKFCITFFILFGHVRSRPDQAGRYRGDGRQEGPERAGDRSGRGSRGRRKEYHW